MLSNLTPSIYLPVFSELGPQLLRRVRESHGPGRQGQRKLSFRDFVWGLVMHALSASGSLGHHLRTMSGVHISDEAAIQRRSNLPWEWFEALFEDVLHPRARRDQHPESFYHGHRLLGVDGTQWSLRNTPAIASKAGTKHRNAKSEAAFFKYSSVVLLELGTHQPLGVARALPQAEGTEGELTLARRVLGAIPRQEDTLLLADRYYGCARFICDVQQAAGTRCQVLLRVKASRQSEVIRSLSDGSALVETKVCHPGSNRTAGLMQLREIRGGVWRQTGAQEGAVAQPSERTEVRLWTTLLDEKKYPAKDLLALYAQRWEEELFFRELKRHTGREHLLRASSPQGADAEFGSLIIAASLLAQQRLAAAAHVAVEPRRISVGKIGKAMEELLPVLHVAAGLITTKQRQKIIARFMQHAARESVIKPRRSRSCPRGLRKSQCSWPRIRHRTETNGPYVFEVTAI